MAKQPFGECKTRGCGGAALRDGDLCVACVERAHEAKQGLRELLVNALQHCETASAELLKAWERCNEVRAALGVVFPVADKITDAQRGAYVAVEQLSIIISRLPK